MAHKTQELAIDYDLCQEVMQVIYALYQNMTAGVRTPLVLEAK